MNNEDGKRYKKEGSNLNTVLREYNYLRYTQM